MFCIQIWIPLEIPSIFSNFEYTHKRQKRNRIPLRMKKKFPHLRSQIAAKCGLDLLNVLDSGGLGWGGGADWCRV